MRLRARDLVGTAVAVRVAWATAAASPRDSPPAGTVSYDVFPTAQLVVDDDAQRRRLTSAAVGDSAVYGALERFGAGSALKDEFDAHRHVSRHNDDDETTTTRRRRLAATDSNKDLYQVTPLFQGFGTHYATVWVGTPPQRKSVIVDTGSHFTAFPCVGCESCGEEHHTDKYFDPSASSTFVQIPCAECHGMSRCKTTDEHGERCVFSQGYTEGSSWSAYQAKDRFFVGGNDFETAPHDPIDNSFATEFMFGCQTSETGLFVTQLADGIMGMSAHPTTLVKQMYDVDILPKNMFSMCFRRELKQTKEGVTAGLLTLGGIDTRLHTSPFVYAKNVAPNGWYTVNVKNIFLRTTGGRSAALKANDDSESNSAKAAEKILKLDMDNKAVNSGKGVIIDSGTTDTYLSKSLQAEFYKVWKDITGMSYNNNPIKMSKEQVDKLPTLLIQMEAWSFDEKQENDLMLGMQDATGLVGVLDTDHPGDILLAIPAAHFYEYSPSKDTYTSRLYFNEKKGGVIGANAMQGHDILFDWENGRVGFAESTCNYHDIKDDLDNLRRPNSDSAAATGPTDEGHERSIDCVLSEPYLAERCSDNVNLEKVCSSKTDPASRVHGVHQKFSFVVERTGSGMNGKNCKQVASQRMNQQGAVTCAITGTCTAVVPCHMSCEELREDAAKGAPKEVELATVEEAGGVAEGACGDNTWGACTVWCEQSRVRSFMADDGQCHENENEVEVRPCHIDACGSHDPCRVPFVVHAVMVVAGVTLNLWTKVQEEIFVNAFADQLNGLGGIGPGDVDVLMVDPWRPEDGKDDLGVKLVLEVSIFNSTKPKTHHTLPDDENNWGVVGKAFGKFEDELSQSEIIANCMEEDLYDFAKTALDLHNRLQRKRFMVNLLERLPSKDMANPASAFDGVHLPGSSQLSEVVSSWTILTHKGSVHDHARDFTLIRSSNFTKAKLKAYVTDLPLMACFFGTVIFLVGVGAWFGIRWEVKRGRRSVIVQGANKIRQIRTNKAKGQYARVGATDNNNYNNSLGDVEFT